MALDFSQHATEEKLDFSSEALDFSAEASSPKEEPGLLTKAAIGIQEGAAAVGREAVPLLDMAAGFPAQLAGYATKLSLAGAAHLTGDEQSLKHARESVEASFEQNPALVAPVKTLLEKTGVTQPRKAGEAPTSNVEAGFEKLTEAINRAGDYWTEASGKEGVGELVKFGAESAMIGAPLPLKHVPVKAGYEAVTGKVRNTATAIKEKIVTQAEPKKVDPDFEKSRIQPDESVSEVLKRKSERLALEEKLKGWEEREAAKPSVEEAPKTPQEAIKTDEVTPTQPEAVKEAPKPSEGGIAEQAAEGTKKPPLARTDKDGVVTIDEAAAKADFEAGFPYIFDADTPTGYQKSLVFAELGLTKEEFHKLIPDYNTYKDFLQAHEESHVRNGDHAAYPRIAEGKLDLTSPKALAIESRATADALRAVNKPTPLEVVVQNVQEHITKQAIEHPSTVEAASALIEKSANAILADTRKAEIFAKSVEETIPNPTLREKMSLAKEAEKPYDKLLTDAEKQKVLYGGEDRILKDGSKKVVEYKDGKPVFEKDLGLVGALERMKKSLEDGSYTKKYPDRASFELKIERLEHVVKKLEAMGSEEAAIKVLEKIDERLDAIGEKALRLGMLDALRKNYVPHVLDWSKFKGTEIQRQAILDRLANAPKESKLVRDFTQQRKYQFLRELEKLLEDTGVVVHRDISKIMLAYEQAMQTAIIHKSMLDFLKAHKGPDGKPWILPDGAEAIANKYASFEGVGSTPLRGMRVHPDLVDAMGFMFRERDPSIVVRGLGAISHLTKALNTVGSLFHAKSLMEAGFLTDPALFLKEVFTGGSGAKAALRAFQHDGANPLIDLLVREGGLMVKVEDIQRTIVADSGVFLDNVATNLAKKSQFLGKDSELNIVKHITDPLDKVVLQKLNSFTWDYMHAAQKLNVATHLFTKMKLKNPQIPDAVLAREVSTYVNNTFGGLNWLQVANSVHSKFGRAVAMKAAGIAGREWAQILLFAPDWTVSTLRAFTTALPKELIKPQNWQLREGAKGIINPKTQGDLARRYVVATALAWVTIINAINIAISGHEIWENKDPTRVDLGDGTSMQAAKHSMEAMHWLQHPDKTLGNKLGFWPKAVFVSTTGVAYPSPDAPKLKDTSMLGRAGAVTLLGMPFQVSSAIQAPEGEGAKRAALSTLGLPIYGVSKEHMAATREKNKKEKAAKRKEEKKK